MSNNEKKQNLQDTFLNSVRKSKTPLTIFLVNGVKLRTVSPLTTGFAVFGVAFFTSFATEARLGVASSPFSVRGAVLCSFAWREKARTGRVGG